MNEPFDEFAKKVSGARTRREALRHIGVGILAATFGSLAGKASAAPNLGNSPCAHWCTDNFPPGAARGKCISDAAKGKGPCYDCGPAATSAHGPLCGGVCCASDEICEGGLCTPAGNPDPECSGQTCDTFVPCSDNNSDCVCASLVTGGGVCVPGSTPCASLVACEADLSCPPGSVCSVGTCCGDPVCIPLELHDLCVDPQETGFTAAAFAWTGGGGPSIGNRGD